jgi:predicted Zn-dependent protease
LKSSRKRTLRAIVAGAGTMLIACASLGAIRPLWHGLPLLFAPGHGIARWIENVQAGSEIEKALYRAMQLPGGEILFRRTPHEAIPALNSMEQTQKTAALYSLRALEEEQNLDFAAAERDWKTWADQADDRIGAHLDLADFYERRLQAGPEVAALEIAGNAPSDPRERWTAAEYQRSWKAFDRALKVTDEYALPRAESDRLYAAWVKRYPQTPTVYESQFDHLLEGKEWSAAASVIEQYRAAFPADHVFPVKAEANLARRRGSAKDGLAIYEARFEPLWPAELVKDYFSMVIDSHGQRAFSDALRAKLAANPDDLKDVARLFYLYQQQGQMDSAKAVLAHFREQKESRGVRWAAVELDTLEKLYEAIQDFPEAARYAYALAADKTAPDSEREGLIALTRILLTAPEQPLRIGAGNLSLYKNIATMDRGPGYLNGILSLWLNTQGPENEYANEDQLATPYFHRARAAELLAQIDARFADDPARPQLHASLMEAYAAYGENLAVIREGTAILAQFPNFDGRVHVALGLADAYERTHETEKEFAVYQQLLKELSARADGVPLGASNDAYSKPIEGELPRSIAKPEAQNDEAGAATTPDTQAPVVRSVQYNEVLNRYLARLVALHRLPDALSVLRGELDRNPQDPGLYQKLADFLEQNRLNSHEEDVYQRAIQQFQDTGWYAKLARFYLRQRRNADYSALMRKVADVFSGTDLEQFLNSAPAPNRSLALEVNLYAHQQFPHDLRFVERLISEYSVNGNSEALEKLLWEHWWESPALRDQLFAQLSRTGKLDAELATLKQQSPEIDKADWNGLAERNPAAEQFYLDASFWQSHFEQGEGAAAALANAYPANRSIGQQASSLYRSLAYFHLENTDKAVAVEKRLLEAEPADLDTLARIGDIYADHERFNEAAPYWVRMGDVHPGESNGYLQSATVFWDYFDFASAQAQLEKGRTRLNDPVLFGYQAGAIAESRGDLPAAVQSYTASATAENPSSESRDRLLALARRPALRAQVEQATAGLLKQPSPRDAAIQLRASILEAEHRKDDLARELKDAVAQTGSFDVLDAVANAARSHSLPEVEEAALRRQVALTTDPVRNLQLRYQLVDFLQQRSAAAAAQEIDAIDREQPKILGVVRSTVDYDWDHDRKPQAITVLLDAAQASYPELKSRFQLEAARKLIETGEFARSRVLLTSLLGEKPLDAGYESAMADNLARSNDTAGLETFYRSQLELVRKANLNRDEKQQRVGQLRRGMIAAATQLGNSNEAIDQYIELINAFPEDADLAQEAALYAVGHNSRDRLFNFYQKTISESPRDPRWSIVLARLATAAEDNALAIDAYGKALKLRPERQDLYIAQATLDERMHRLDDAIALYRKLYTLSYRDPSWMGKVAELSARQGHAADAIKALETGWIDGRPAKAANFFAVAERLEKWGLLEDAGRFAEQGVQQAGADLLVSEQTGAATYARIMARQRRSAAAFVVLAAARDQAPKITLATVAQQVVKNGIAAVTDEEWRKSREEERRSQATTGFAIALKAMSTAAAEFYTPEEKTEFAGLLQQKSSGASADELGGVYLPAAQAAGLAQLSADMMWDAAVRHDSGNANFTEWIQFGKRRVQMSTVGARLEKFAPTAEKQTRAQVWRDAAEAYRAAGDSAGELRTTERINEMERLEGDELLRYYRLLLAQRPAELIQKASSEDSAAQYLIRNGTADQALKGIGARGAGRPAVWKDAYTALAGLYLHEQHPEFNAAFSSALDAEANIGERIAHPADRNVHLAGAVWFYYGSRYGEYLDSGSDSRASDYLESELEHTPGSSGAYLRLADYSNRANRQDSALTDYQHSLDLRRDQPAVLDSIATIQWNAGRHSEALAAWSDAVKCLAEEMDARHVPETFWGDFESVLGSVSAHGQYDSVHQAVDAMLRIYIARNGNYRVEPLLRAGYHANGDSVDWLLTITTAASSQDAVLAAILPDQWSNQGDWLRKDQLSRIYARIFELAQQNRSQIAGAYDGGLDSTRLNYAGALLKEKKYVEARAVMAQVPAAQQISGQWLPIVLALADVDGTLPQLLNSWKKLPATAPTDNDLRSSTVGLSEKARRAVQRFVYERALDRRELTAVNFLGLAALDLDEGDTAGAVQLLKRLTLVSANIYADTDAAARLLEERGKAAEALQFLKPLAEDSPWNSEYKVRLARETLAVSPQQASALATLKSVAADPQAAYKDRAAAAEALKGQALPGGVSVELQLLAQSSCPTADAVSKPLFVRARVAAAECTTSPKVKEHLLLDALAMAPANTQIRLRYIWSAFAANDDSRALVAADQYMQSYYYSNPADAAEGDDAIGVSAGTGDEDTDAGSAKLAALKPAQAVKLIQLAAAAYESKREYADAARIIAQGMQIVNDAVGRKTLEDKQKKINEEIARDQENDARAPNVRPELDQDRIVKGKLLSGMPVPARPTQEVEQ